MSWYLIAVGLATLLYFGLVNPFTFWKRRGIPQLTLWQILSQNVKIALQLTAIPEEIKQMYNAFSTKRYAGIYQFFLPTLLVRDPSLIKQITVKDFDHFVDHIEFVPKDSEPIWERNVFASTGERWRELRTILSPLYTSSKMKMMFGLISDCADQFTQYFENKNLLTVEVEMKDTFTRFANDVIASTAFGVTCNSLKHPNNEFYLRGRQLTNFSNFWNNIRFILMLLFPKIIKMFGFTFFSKEANDFFKNVIKENIAARQEKGIVRPDMIHLLMEARRKGKSEINAESSLEAKEILTDDDITAQAVIFFFAGFETISTVMSFMAFELAINPDIQDQLISEVDDTLAECGEEALTYEALSQMKYLDMVISETLRKWPPGISLDRVCVKPYSIQPVHGEAKPLQLQKGDALWIPVIGLHRDPVLFPNPDEFNPERFNEVNKSKIDPYTYVPFGVGPRNCMGNRFAIMELKILFLRILSKFKLTTITKTMIPLKLDKSKFQLSSEGGFWLGLQRRK